MGVGDRLKELYALTNKKQAEVSANSGVANSTMSDLAKNIIKSPSVELMIRLSKGFEMNPLDLIKFLYSSDIEETNEMKLKNDIYRNNLKLLRGNRTQIDYSQELMKAGIIGTYETLRQFESGEVMIPTVILKRIAEYEGVELDLFESEIKNKEDIEIYRKKNVINISHLPEEIQRWLSDKDNTEAVKALYDSYKRIKG